ncbi:MAG: ester cyclase [Deltaproteobacteria bacterium]|nr:ester cyclase [Deltaproteobacteria bacterium]
MLVIAFGLGLAGGAGCKKKSSTETGAGSSTMSGSSTTGTAAGSAGGTAMGSAGSAAGSAEAPKETPKTGNDLAAKYTDCVGHINAGKFDDFKSQCIAADYKGHQVDAPVVASADDAINYFKGNRVAFPDMKLAPQLVLINGRNVLAVNLATGAHTGVMKTPMGDVPATNKKIGQLLFHRLAINDENRANEEWVFMDPSTMMGQLGMLPKEAGPSRLAMEKGLEGAPVVVIATDDAKEKANLEVVTKANAAFNTHKMADAMAFYADDAVEADQAGSKDHKGKKDIEAGTSVLLKGFSDFKIESQQAFAAGDYVVTLGAFTGTHDGPLGPLKATGKKVNGSFAEIFKLKDGKITEVWRFRNGMTMAAQLGLMGDAPKGEAPKAEPKAEKKG